MIAPLYDWTFRRVVWATLVLVFVALSFWVFYRFNGVVFILFISNDIFNNGNPTICIDILYCIIFWKFEIYAKNQFIDGA